MTSHRNLSTRAEHVGTMYFVALLREELGRRIATARHAAGLSQQALADKVGLKHAQDISRYERGVTEVPSHRIDLIAEATSRPRSFFTRDPAEPEPATPTDDADLRQMIREEVVAALGPIERLLRRLDDQAPRGSGSTSL